MRHRTIFEGFKEFASKAINAMYMISTYILLNGAISYSLTDGYTNIHAFPILLGFFVPFIPAYIVGKMLDIDQSIGDVLNEIIDDIAEHPLIFTLIVIALLWSGFLYFTEGKDIETGVNAMLNSEILKVYLLGSLATVILYILNQVVFGTIRWFMKLNVMTDNYNKLVYPFKPESIRDKATKHLLSVVFESIFSWISVLIQIYGTFRGLLEIIREVFSDKPENIKELIYPLKNNPNLKAEHVWAYVAAIGILDGNIMPNKGAIASELQQSVDANNKFNYELAVEKLKTLHAVEEEQLANMGRSYRY